MWSQIKKLGFLEIWDAPWQISIATTRRRTFTTPGEFDEDRMERVSGMVHCLSGDEDLQGFNASILGGALLVGCPLHRDFLAVPSSSGALLVTPRHST